MDRSRKDRLVNSSQQPWIEHAEHENRFFFRGETDRPPQGTARTRVQARESEPPTPWISAIFGAFSAINKSCALLKAQLSTAAEPQARNFRIAAFKHSPMATMNVSGCCNLLK